MSNEMNEAYKKAIIVLSEMMPGEESPGSTSYKRKMTGGSLATRNRMARYRQLDRRSGKQQTHKVHPGMQTAHTDPTPGPSLHEDYVRMAEILVEKGLLRRVGKKAALGAALAAATAAQSSTTGKKPAPKPPSTISVPAKGKPQQAQDLQLGQHKKLGPQKAKGKPAQGPQFVGDAERGGHRIAQVPKPKPKGKNWLPTALGASLGAGYVASRLARRERRKAQQADHEREYAKTKPNTPPPVIQKYKKENVRSHTDPTPGPSLHETYGRLINIILEYKKRSKEDWERVRLGSELIDPTGKPLTGQQRRKISLTKERADRKKAAKRKKAAAKRAKAKKKAPAPDPNHGWSVADEPLHYL